jgi:hypothetical protein
MKNVEDGIMLVSYVFMGVEIEIKRENRERERE